MSAPAAPEPVAPEPFDPFGLAASMDAWCCLLKAARELGAVDAEMMATMLETGAAGPAPLPPDAVAKVRNLAHLMRGLNLDPDAVRGRAPETMRALEAACLACTERSRCTRELRAGTATATHPGFCPNVRRLDTLRDA